MASLEEFREKFSATVPDIKEMDDDDLADYIYEEHVEDQLDVSREQFNDKIGYTDKRFASWLPDPIEAGLIQGISGLEKAFYEWGITDTRDVIEDDLRRKEQALHLAGNRYNDEEREFLREITENPDDLDYADLTKKLWSRPDLASGLLIESVSSSIPLYGATGVASGLTLLATRNPGLAVRVAASIIGAGEGTLEYGAELNQLIQEELGENSRDPSAVMALLFDREKMDEFDRRAADKGLVVGAGNAALTQLGGIFAGKLLGGAGLLGKPGRTAGVLGLTAGTQAVGEGAVEAVSQVASGANKIHKADVLLEAMGGMLTSPIEIGLGAMQSYKHKRGIEREKVLDDLLGKLSPEERSKHEEIAKAQGVSEEIITGMDDKTLSQFTVNEIDRVANDPYGVMEHRADMNRRGWADTTKKGELYKGQTGNRIWFGMAGSKYKNYEKDSEFDPQDLVDYANSEEIISIFGEPLKVDQGILSPDIETVTNQFAAQGILKREKQPDGSSRFIVTDKGAAMGVGMTAKINQEGIDDYKKLGIVRMPGAIRTGGEMETGVNYHPDVLSQLSVLVNEIDSAKKGNKEALKFVREQKNKGVIDKEIFSEVIEPEYKAAAELKKEVSDAAVKGKEKLEKVKKVKEEQLDLPLEHKPVPVLRAVEENREIMSFPVTPKPWTKSTNKQMNMFYEQQNEAAVEGIPEETVERTQEGVSEAYNEEKAATTKVKETANKAKAAAIETDIQKAAKARFAPTPQYTKLVRLASQFVTGNAKEGKYLTDLWLSDKVRNYPDWTTENKNDFISLMQTEVFPNHTIPELKNILNHYGVKFKSNLKKLDLAILAYPYLLQETQNLNAMAEAIGERPSTKNKIIDASAVIAPVLETHFDVAAERNQQELNQQFIEEGLVWLQEQQELGNLTEGRGVGPGDPGMLGNQGQVQDGEEVTVRLNVSTFKDAKNYKAKDAGVPLFNPDHKPIGVITFKKKGKNVFHHSYATLDDVTFVVKQGQAAKTFEGAPKNVHAEVKGIERTDVAPFTTAFDEEGNLQGDVVPIGYNPKTGTLFVDLRNGRPVKSAERVTVVGDRVYAKGITEDSYYTKEELVKINPQFRNAETIDAMGILIASPVEIAQLNLVNDMASRQLNMGDSIAQSYTEAQKLEIIQWIQKLIGDDVTVRLEEVSELLVDAINKRRDAGLTNDEDVRILGYADPIEKVIVAALDTPYLYDVVGEEAFHIAERLLLSDAELAVLHDPSIDWADIAAKNDIDLEAYSADPEIRSFEARGKIAAKILNGKAVKGLPSRQRGALKQLKNILQKLANFIKGKGWHREMQTPQEIMLSFSRGELARRNKRMYPIGHSTSIAQDFAAIKDLTNTWNQMREARNSPDIADKMGLFSGLWQNWISHPIRVAAKNVYFQPIFNTAYKMMSLQNQISARAYKDAKEFIDLTSKGRNAEVNRIKVEEYLVLLDLLNIDAPAKAQDGTYTFYIPDPYDINDDGTAAHPELLERGAWLPQQLKRQGFEIGQRIHLNEEQARAYDSYKKADTFIKEMFKTAVVRYLLRDVEGLETDVLATQLRIDTPEGLSNFYEVKKAEFELLKQEREATKTRTKEEDTQFKKAEDDLLRLRRVKDLLYKMEQNPNYIPRHRSPGAAIVVKHIDPETGQATTIDVSTHPIPQIAKGLAEVPFRTRQKRRQMEREVEYLKTIYTPEEGFIVDTIENFGFTDKENFVTALNQGTVTLIEGLQTNLGMDASQDINFMLEMLDDLITNQEFGNWVERKRQGISGYYRPGKFNEQTGERMAEEGWENQGSYLGPAFNNYVGSMSYRIASVRYKPEMRKMIDDLKEKSEGKPYTRMRAAHDYAEKWLEYIGDPTQALGWAKSLAFHGFMGLNVSSAILNMMQIPQALFPLMMAMAGGRVDHMWYITTAFKDSIQLIKRNGFKSLNTYGLDFANPPKNFQNKDGSANDEWLMLQRLFEKGIATPMNAQDLGAWIPPQYGTARRFTRGLMDFSGYAFGAVEFSNRATSALAAYRMAKNNPVVLERFSKYRQHTFFRDGITDEYKNMEMTPELAAEMAILGSQYMMNKFNRPMIFHSFPGIKGTAPIMEIVTQFMSFPWQYLEMFGTAFRMSKDKETRTMGLRMILLMGLTLGGLSGMMGFPPMENLRRLIRLLTAGNWDLEFEAREMFREMGIGELGEDILFGGFPSVIPYVGFESRWRMGMGSPMRDDILRGDFGGMLGPAFNFVYDSISTVVEGVREGKPMKALTGFIPIAGARNAFDVGTIMQDGMKTRNGTVHLSAGELTTPELLIKSIGFTPARYAARRDADSYRKYIGNAGTSKRDVETRSLTNQYLRILDAQEEGKTAEAQEAYTDFIESFYEYNQEYYENPETMLPIKMATVKKRALNAKYGPRSRYYFRGVPKFRRHRLRYGRDALRAHMWD